jgi:hypothetical protein
MEYLAIANVPMQQYCKLYSPQKALRRGTVFAELDKTWHPHTADKEVHRDEQH